MKSLKALNALSVAVVAALGVHSASATVISQWSFSATNAGPVNTLPATTDVTGSAIAQQLGMTNSYTYAAGEGPGSTAACDITSVTGAVSAVSQDTWRIRGNSNTKNAGAGNANGWNNSAPDYTQGAEFSVNTTGYTDIGLSFDWFSTKQGVANMQVRYTTDGINFTNLGSDFIASAGDFFGDDASEPNISIDLSAIPGASNNPDFAVEMVSVRPVATDANYPGPSDPNFIGAAGGDYNNSSGNWSFNNITISGTATAVPEPASASLLGLAGLAILRRRRIR